MDRERRDEPAPGDLSSFDVSKKSEAEVAFELGAHMTHWRRAHEPSNAQSPEDEPKDGRPPADRPPMGDGAVSEAPNAAAVWIDTARRVALQAQTPQPESTEADLGAPDSWYRPEIEKLLADAPDMDTFEPWPELSFDEAPEYDHAAGAATQAAGVETSQVQLPARQDWIDRLEERTRAIGLAAQSAGVAAPDTPEPALEPGVDEVQRPSPVIDPEAREPADAMGRALAPGIEKPVGRMRSYVRGIAAWEIVADRLVLASVAVLAVAVAGWLLTLPKEIAPPEVVRSQETPPPETMTARTDNGVPAAAESSDSASFAPPPRVSDTRAPNVAPEPAQPLLKPVARRQVLAARLKPVTSRAATPSADLAVDASPAITPEALITSAGPQEESTEEPGAPSDPNDIDGILERMFSDGINPGLSRQRGR